MADPEALDTRIVSRSGYTNVNVIHASPPALTCEFAPLAPVLGSVVKPSQRSGDGAAAMGRSRPSVATGQERVQMASRGRGF